MVVGHVALIGGLKNLLSDPLTLPYNHLTIIAHTKNYYRHPARHQVRTVTPHVPATIQK